MVADGGQGHPIRRPVEVERTQTLARIALVSPPVNALSMATLDAILDALEKLAADPQCRVVVLAGSGDVFSTGLDWGELAEQRDGDDHGRGFFRKTAERLSEVALAIFHHPVPVIAEVNGLATDAGCELVACCDLAIASENAEFQVPGIQMGLLASLPMVGLSRAVGPKHAMEMLLTGERIDARTAREFGLVNRVVPPEYLGTIVGKYAARIAARPGEVLRRGKDLFRRQAGMNRAEAYALAAGAMEEGLMGDHTVTAIAALLETRATKGDAS